MKTLSKHGQMELRSPSFNTPTYCDSVPRVFSGISLSFCTTFVGPPANLMTKSDDLLLFAIFDMGTSAAVDFLVLPYTGVMQFRHGNLPVNQLPDPLRLYESNLSYPLADRD